MLDSVFLVFRLLILIFWFFLPEYFNATSPTQGPVYTDFGVGKSFACTCVIPGDSTVYGGTMNVFPTKKAAQVNAAREAMQSLISAGLVESDGSLKVKKKVKCGTAVKVEGGGLGVNKNTSYAQRVNGICSRIARSLGCLVRG